MNSQFVHLLAVILQNFPHSILLVYLNNKSFSIIIVSEIQIKSPRFAGSSWLAFPALKAAYKHIQLDLEFRPEAWNGILLLTGERDDLQGDFMAVILHHGFIEFR